MRLRLEKKLFIIPFYVLRTNFYVVMPMLCNVSLNTPIACSLVRFRGMTSSLAIVNKSLSCAFLKFPNSLMFFFYPNRFAYIKDILWAIYFNNQKIVAYHL